MSIRCPLHHGGIADEGSIGYYSIAFCSPGQMGVFAAIPIEDVGLAPHLYHGPPPEIHPRLTLCQDSCFPAIAAQKMCSINHMSM